MMPKVFWVSAMLPAYTFGIRVNMPKVFWVSAMLQVQMKIMGSQKYENVGASQSLLITNDPIISTCTRTCVRRLRVCRRPVL
jgi:hypothetical protein